MRWSKKELNWKIDLEEETMLTGDQEQWSKLLENVLENQIRYAETFIDISVRSTKEHTLITIKNDGPHIEEEMLSSLYEPFNKGKKGEFGIGLSIVKRILTLHHADMTIRNDQTGVCYSISVPRN
ncbi:signal transduction histidine kinase [Bacillus sp. SLBN-57]